MEAQIITDQKGRKTGVILSLKDYAQLKERAEALADINAYDKAKASLANQKLFPLREVINQRKQNRRNGK